MTAREFCMLLKEKGINFSTGVPCSVLKNVIDYLSGAIDIPYVFATREDEAIGIATGAYLGGKRPVVLMQNSGLGNSIGALSSLNIVYKIPILLLVSWRGYRGEDAPEHFVMGGSIVKLLKDIGVPIGVLQEGNVEEVLSSSMKVMREKNIPAAILIRKGVIE